MRGRGSFWSVLNFFSSLAHNFTFHAEGRPVGGYRTASKDEAGRPQRFQPPPDCPHYAEAGRRGSVGVATLLDKLLTRNMKPFCGFNPPD